MLGEITRPWRAVRPVTLLGLLCVLALGFAGGLLALPFLHWQSGKTALELGALLLAALVIHSMVRNAAKVQALTQSLQDENSYRSFVMSAIEGVFRTTHDGQYLFANPALARIYGHSTPEHLMRELTNIADQLYVNPGRRKEFQRELQENGYSCRFPVPNPPARRNADLDCRKLQTRLRQRRRIPVLRRYRRGHYGPARG